MSFIYAMQRANGDWFALDDHGSFRVPMFHTSGDGMRARSLNSGMQLFKPVALDELALDDLVPSNGAGDVYFWLVDDPFIHLSHGQPISRAQLALLLHDAPQRPKG